MSSLIRLVLKMLEILIAILFMFNVLSSVENFYCMCQTQDSQQQMLSVNE